MRQQSIAVSFSEDRTDRCSVAIVIHFVRVLRLTAHCLAAIDTFDVHILTGSDILHRRTRRKLNY